MADSAKQANLNNLLGITYLIGKIEFKLYLMVLRLSKNVFF